MAAIVSDSSKAGDHVRKRTHLNLEEQLHGTLPNIMDVRYTVPRIRHPKDKAFRQRFVKLRDCSRLSVIEECVFKSRDELEHGDTHIALDFNEKADSPGREPLREGGSHLPSPEEGPFCPMPEKLFIIAERKLMTVGTNC